MTTLASQSSLNAKIYSICDIMRRGNLSGALEYIPELTWLLFLRILDEQEELEATEAQIVRAPFTPSLSYPYRWQDWASPAGMKRQELQNSMAGDVFRFANEDLISYLHELKDQPSATSRQKVISAVLSAVQRVRIDTERNFLDVLDRIDEIRQETIDPTHIFTLSQAYEGLLLRMGEKNNDGGQFFTPREVIRAMVRVVGPRAGETVFDPGCGTGGFLAQSYEYMKNKLGDAATADQISALGNKTFFGKEKADQIFPICLANMVLHGIDEPNIWHGNTLTGNETYGGLFQDAPQQFDVILMNPPFAGRADQVRL